MRRSLRWIRAHALEWSGANTRSRERLDGTCAAILTYHRVLPHDRARAEAVEPGMYVAPETLRRHLAWLGDAYCVLPLREIVERLANAKPLPRFACAISFDDGWRDNRDHALPELTRRQLPATVFVVSERIGTAGAFWPDEVCRRLRALPPAERQSFANSLDARRGGDPLDASLTALKVFDEAARERALERLRALGDAAPVAKRELLDWDEVAELAAAGLDIEAHGATHRILPGLPRDVVRDELGRARERLRERGYGRGDLLAYPSGAWDGEVAQQAREVGYRAAFTTERGLARASLDEMALPRLGIHDDVAATRAEFRRTVPGSAPRDERSGA